MWVLLNRKVDLSLTTRGNVTTVSAWALSIDHDISRETCLSSARCVEGKQHPNKESLVLVFVKLEAIPISQAYKRTDRSRPNHISLRISNDSAKMKSPILFLFLGATVALAEIHVGDDPHRKKHRKILVSLNSLLSFCFVAYLLWQIVFNGLNWVYRWLVVF